MERRRRPRCQVSIVVPVYRSAECLDELARRVRKDVGSHFERYELILVNDHSPDESWSVIRRLVQEFDFVNGIDLRMNVGQDNAIMAGLAHSSGDVVVIMDDDLQHDPADVVRLCAEIEAGSDVVYANFEKKEQALWKNLGSWLNDRVAVVLLGKPRDLYMSPYKAIRRAVVREIARYDGPFTYVDGILFTITSHISQIEARHHARFAGSGSYDLVRSIRVWLKLVTSFSVIPLRIVSLLGGIIALFSLLFGGYQLIDALLDKRDVEGWASLIVSIFFLGGIQLLSIGAVGEYVGRVFLTINRRPQYAVREACWGWEESPDAEPDGSPSSGQLDSGGGVAPI